MNLTTTFQPVATRVRVQTQDEWEWTLNPEEVETLRCGVAMGIYLMAHKKLDDGTWHIVAKIATKLTASEHPAIRGATR